MNRTLTHDDEFEEDDLEFRAATTVHLSFPDMQSHLTTILDDRPIEDLIIMAIHEFDKYYDDYHSLFLSSSIDLLLCFFPFLQTIRHLFSDIGRC